MAVEYLGNLPKNELNFKSVISVHTELDDKWHNYFSSFSFDAQDTEFMSTAELVAPYANELMGYWQPIVTEVSVYGANHDKNKLIYVGRVREVKQDGYNLVISLQNYGWKFEQTCPPDLATELTGVSCDVVLEMIMEVLKIESWTMDPKTKYFLQQYAFDQNGEIVKGNDTLENIPDLIERIGEYTPIMTKDTIDEKLKEDKKGNLKNINYTMKYTEPTPVMKKLKEKSTADPNIVQAANTYADSQLGQATTGSITAGANTMAKSQFNCNDINHDKQDNRVKIDAALCTIKKYVHGKVDSNSADLTNAINRIRWFHKAYGASVYRSSVQPWLNTILNGSSYDKSKQKSFLNNKGLHWY